MQLAKTKEYRRLHDTGSKKWGPYLSERQWGTVREDYSANGTAWDYLPHDMARSRAYRWGEDGIGGFSDDRQHLCFSLALWNGRDPIIKERMFGLTGNEGNHGEDVKECYYYLENTPSHSYLKMLYKYPQREFPYGRLVEENSRRGKSEPEFEILDTGVFDDNRYFDVFIEYAKASNDDILIRITAANRANESAMLNILPQVFFRNTWSWRPGVIKPSIRAEPREQLFAIEHSCVGAYTLSYEGEPELLFCENETNTQRVFGRDSAQRYFKDGVNEYLVHGNKHSVNSGLHGTKAALRYVPAIPAGGSSIIRLRLSAIRTSNPFSDFDAKFSERIGECDEFYIALQADVEGDDLRLVQRQALAGLLWSKQYYSYSVREWLEGDPLHPKPPESRRHGRNSAWQHLENNDIISMPDKWEYPWYAAWDLAFHCVAFAQVDPYFAKDQLRILTHDWYMHPNGQLPAYEWAFGDVNPPVHAWATWRVYKIDAKINGGEPDLDFLEHVFLRLLINFTWWVNRKDDHGDNIFQGGFLGLDNIGVFDRSAPLPTGGHLEQSDATAWMAMFCLNMMRIGIELAARKPVYQDLAAKFFEHFLGIAQAMMNMGGEGIRLWDDEDEFYYDVLHLDSNGLIPLKVRSLVGVIPLFAVEVLEPEVLKKVPLFKERLEFILARKPELAALISRWQEPGTGERRLLSLLRGHRVKRLLRRMLDETEFLSDYGVRALSKHYEQHPYKFETDGSELTVKYQPAESDSGLFGGNSNWRGPIWFPVNYLIIEALQRFHHYYGDDFRVECPTGSKQFMTIGEVADELSRRLLKIFTRNAEGNRPVLGHSAKLQDDPYFRDYVLFYEYFHGDNGRGVGASHQTGWTALAAKLIQSSQGKSNKNNVGASSKKNFTREVSGWEEFVKP